MFSSGLTTTTVTGSCKLYEVEDDHDFNFRLIIENCGSSQTMVKLIRVLKARHHTGHVRPGTAVEVEEVQALRAARFLCLVSAALTSVVFLLCHVGRSSAGVSHMLTSMSKSFRDVLRESLKRFFCPPTERLPWYSSLYSSCCGSRLSVIRST